MAAKIFSPLVKRLSVASASGRMAPMCKNHPFQITLLSFCTCPKGFEYTETKGDLFSCPETDALAHCISADIAMGKGIAVIFKNKFGGVKELKDQGKKVGEVAVLKRESRFVYYLITKERYFHKPTYDTLTDSLRSMKKHSVDNNVECISMPKIGCGLDGLKWDKVSAILKDVFKETDIHIKVYTL